VDGEELRMTQSLLDHIGGDAGLRKLVNDFYDQVETLPQGEKLRRLHARGHGVAHAREEQFNFMSGFMGGRRHYMEKHGHMNLKQIHQHLPLTEQDAEDWLFCMDRALAMNALEGPEIEKLRKALRRACLMLVNTE
jgi:hemoglobin